MLHLKRISDPDYLLCHKCGQRLDGAAHKACAEAARADSVLNKKESKIKHASVSRVYEGVGTIGHSPCRLDDGSIIIPADEARKIREKGFTCRQTRVKYGPWSNGRLRERSRIKSKKEIEEVIEEIDEDLDNYEDNEEEDLFSLANGYSSKIFLMRLFSSGSLEEPLEP